MHLDTGAQSSVSLGLSLSEASKRQRTACPSCGLSAGDLLWEYQRLGALDTVCSCQLAWEPREWASVWFSF